MKYYVLIILLFSLNIVFSQNETNVWYFGTNAGLDFNSGSPVPLLDGSLDTFEGCATISDLQGNLLFYTDGSTVYNQSHNIMLNGDNLNGNSSSTHSAIIVPKPNDVDIYYIFTVDFQGGVNGLQYSEVDMSLDGGLGGITANKNILLETPTTEKLTAIRNSQSDEYWVVSHKWESNEFISYNVSSSGVNLTPVVSAVGSFVGGPIDTSSIGQIKISPDGSKLAVARATGISEVQLFDFDAATGQVSNPITIFDLFPNTEQVYGIEFSPNNNILYVSITGVGVYQYDLLAGSATDIYNSQVELIGLPRPYGALQLARDGKIYIAKNNQFYLDVIDNPDVLGLGCNYQFEHLYLDGRRSRLGLPPFIQSFFNIGFEAEDVCLGEVTQFTANISGPYDSLLWDFGDAVTSTLENPQHTYTSSGDYDVQLTVTIGSETSNETKQVTVFELPVAYQPNDINVCDDDNDGFYDFDLTQRDSEVLNGQDNSIFEVVYYASLDDYNNDNSIIDPSSYANTSAFTQQEIVASIRNINNNDCEDSITFNIQVFESPNPSTNINSLSFCDDTSFGSDSDGVILFDLTLAESEILNSQSATDFSILYFTDSGFTNQISDPTQYQNTNLNETIFVQVVNNDNSDCISETSFDINVYELPTVSTLVVLSQCDDDLDGFTSFNLNEVIEEITTNSASETITFHETQLDAENALNSIIDITGYSNQVVTSDTIWARVENQNGCFRTLQINLLVSTTQIPSSFTRDFYQCDDGIDIYDGVSTFDFSSVTSEVESLFPVSQQPVINYYRNLSDALAENNAIVDASNYENIGYPVTQEIYIRVDSALSNDCLGLGNYITIHVDPRPLITGPIIIEQCDENNDGTESFNTSDIETELLQGQTETITFSYEDEDGNPLPNPLPNPFTITQPILNVFATMTITNPNNPNGGCSVETTISFVMDNSVIANPVDDIIVCDDDNDGLFPFNTSTIESTIINGQTNVIVTYFDEQGNNLPSPLPDPFISETQIITARVDDISGSFCYSETTFSFIVNEQPLANPIDDDIICDDLGNDGEHTFNLSDYDSQILNGQSNSVFEITYHESDIDAQTNFNALPQNYIVNSDSQTVFARIQNINNSDCYDTISFNLGVLYIPIAFQPDDFIVCDDESNDGIEIFYLSSLNSEILNGQSETENTISFYLTQDAADNGMNQIDHDFTNTENPQTIYVRLESNQSEHCYTTTNFNLIINELPVISIPNEIAVCEGESIVLDVGLGYDEYLWSTNETTSSIIVDEAGIYEVTVTNNYGAEGCSSSKTITVVESNAPVIINIETIDWSQSNNSINVYVEGDGDYEYSIDGFNYQDSNMFSGLIVDEYNVYVRDKNGCGLDSEEIYLLYYPKFFTPNGDDYHDYWHLYSSNREPGNKIFIYDRYGKLIKQLSSTDKGWDGTFNGMKLPSNDYWFRLERQNGKQYTGHFSLKN